MNSLNYSKGEITPKNSDQPYTAHETATCHNPPTHNFTGDKKLDQFSTD
jgi:hypothetical protein